MLVSSFWGGLGGHADSVELAGSNWLLFVRRAAKSWAENLRVVLAREAMATTGAANHAHHLVRCNSAPGDTERVLVRRGPSVVARHRFTVAEFIIHNRNLDTINPVELE